MLKESPCLPSTNKKMVIATKNYAEADIKVFLSCPILLNFFTLFHQFLRDKVKELSIYQSIILSSIYICTHTHSHTNTHTHTHTHTHTYIYIYIHIYIYKYIYIYILNIYNITFVT